MSNKEKLAFHANAALSIDEGGQKILQQILQLDLPKRQVPDFKSERPISATIDRSSMQEDPFLSAKSSDGEIIIAFIFKDDGIFGFNTHGLMSVKKLVTQTLKSKWAYSALGDKFIEETILRWCRTSFRNEDRSPLSEEIIAQAEKSIQRRTMWAPIAHLEIEEGFDFGPVRIEPVTKALIDEINHSSAMARPSQADDINQLFENMRAKMQGLAAVVCNFEAEPGYAFEKGLIIANNAVGLLRFFSPSSYLFSSTCLNAPLGSEYTPSMSIILFGDEGSFNWKEGSTLKDAYDWSISKRDLSQIQEDGLQFAAKLLYEEGLNPFSTKVRSSILTYSKGTTLTDSNDRLVYALSSLESLFLRNSSEPIQQNLGERLAFLIAPDSDSRKKIVRNIKEIYNMRSQYVHHRNSIIENESLQYFTYNARLALLTALQNIDRFKSIEEFHDDIDEKKYG